MESNTGPITPWRCGLKWHTMLTNIELLRAKMVSIELAAEFLRMHVTRSCFTREMKCLLVRNWSPAELKMDNNSCKLSILESTAITLATSLSLPAVGGSTLWDNLQSAFSR